MGSTTGHAGDLLVVTALSIRDIEAHTSRICKTGTVLQEIVAGRGLRVDLGPVADHRRIWWLVVGVGGWLLLDERVDAK